MSKKDYWVYILLCDNQSFYTGYTHNLTQRYRSHVNGTGRCKYTRSFKPVCIAQCWHISEDKLLALKLERTIKQYSRLQKIALIEHPSSLSTDPRVQPFNPVVIMESIGHQWIDPSLNDTLC